MLDLDGHGYTNHGTEEDGFENVRHRFEDDDLNLGFLQLFLPSQFASERTKTRLNQPGTYGLFATRDIAAGEGELVCLPSERAGHVFAPLFLLPLSFSTNLTTCSPTLCFFRCGVELFFDYHRMSRSVFFDWHSNLFTRSLPFQCWFVLQPTVLHLFVFYPLCAYK